MATGQMFFYILTWVSLGANVEVLSFMQPNFKYLSFTYHFILINLPFAIVNVVLVPFL